MRRAVNPTWKNVACALSLGWAISSCRSESVRAPEPVAGPVAAAAPASPAVVVDASLHVEPVAAGDARDSGMAVARPFRGPFESAFVPGRSVYYAAPAKGEPARRLVGHLHGICYPPSYSCGKFARAATNRGYLVCPTGNATCGDGGHGPPSWEAASWDELVRNMDRDLEQSIALVSARFPKEIDRDGAILTGFSRGAYAAPVLARLHPGRWPYLVLIEAAAPITALSLRRDGVKAVALVAGENGPERAGMEKLRDALAADGYPVRMFVMPGVGHFYSDNVDQLMSDAFDFVLASGARTDAGTD